MGCCTSAATTAREEIVPAISEKEKSCPNVRQRLKSFAETWSIEVAPVDVKKQKGLLDLLSVPSSSSAAPVLKEGARVYVNMVKTKLEHFSEVAAAVSELSTAGYEPVPHLPAARFSCSKECQESFKSLAKAGASDFLVVGGNDLVERLGSSECAYKEGATSLLVEEMSLWKEHGSRGVSLAGHPDGHPAFANSRTKSTELLLRKARPFLAAGINVTICTQFCFDAHKLVQWLRHTRADLLLLQNLLTVSSGKQACCPGRVFFRIGLPGPTPKKKLERIATICEVPSLFVSSAFDVLDSDQDGFISLQQVEDNASKLGLVRSGSKLQRIYDKHADQDGLLRRLEFCELLVEDVDAEPMPSSRSSANVNEVATLVAQGPVAQGPSTFVEAKPATPAVGQDSLVWPEELVLTLAAFCERESVPQDEVVLHLFPFGGLARTLEMVEALRDDKWPGLSQAAEVAGCASADAQGAKHAEVP